MPSLHGGDGGALEPRVDRELQRRQRLALRHLERADDAAERVDARRARDEAGVQERVVRRLDAGLADDLAGARVRVALRAELRRADLAEQAEELAAEGALRIAARRDGPTLKPGYDAGRSSR